MGSGQWEWIVPDGLWEIAEPLLPRSAFKRSEVVYSDHCMLQNLRVMSPHGQYWPER
ncbi:hypothetical protein [Streptomyces halstedii]|uniref:hypothetical protein n=1 Tax=Streptomyces halstedii TaxID=1944 RepID=UPI003F4DB71A